MAKRSKATLQTDGEASSSETSEGSEALASGTGGVRVEISESVSGLICDQVALYPRSVLLRDFPIPEEQNPTGTQSIRTTSLNSETHEVQLLTSGWVRFRRVADPVRNLPAGDWYRAPPEMIRNVHE